MKNLELLKQRAAHANNDRQHERMILDKKRSFHRALLYSYQTAWIKKDGVEDAQYVRALINPDRLKFDYDEKIVSVDWEHGFQPGDSFEWQYTNTHWLILKQELTELAYFRAYIRRCQLIEAIDPETGELFQVWASVRGPVETDINSIQKAGLVAHVPNLSLQIYMPLTKQTRRTFTRYKRFKFMDMYWQVNTFDCISTPNILEIVAQENYECHHDELIVDIVDPNPPQEDNEPTSPMIEGETFVKPLSASKYTAINVPDGSRWTVLLPAEQANKEIKDVLTWKTQGNTIEVIWTAMVSGSYIIQCGDVSKTIVVQSLF